jgi:hypothetical protein
VVAMAVVVGATEVVSLPPHELAIKLITRKMVSASILRMLGVYP